MRRWLLAAVIGGALLGQLVSSWAAPKVVGGGGVSLSLCAGSDTGWSRTSAGLWIATDCGATNRYSALGAGGLTVRSGDAIGFSSSATNATTAADTTLTRAAAATMGLGTNGGGTTEFRIFSGTNNEFITLLGSGAGSLTVKSNANNLAVQAAATLTLGAGGGALCSLTSGGVLSCPLLGTSTRCANTGSPAVCAAAAAGSVVIAAAATSVVVNTTAVTANSQVFAMIDRSLGTLLSVTCDTTSDLTTGSPAITARTAATSFTIAVPIAPAANPMCLSYFIIN